MVEQVESALPVARRAQVPPKGKAAAEKGLQLGYGATFGMLYGLAAGEGSPLVAGAVLGLATWAVGYLGWLPATGLMPPVTRQEPARVAGPIATHLGYGIATAAAYRWLRRRLERCGGPGRASRPPSHLHRPLRMTLTTSTISLDHRHDRYTQPEQEARRSL
jgi:hypothetical protein